MLHCHKSYQIVWVTHGVLVELATCKYSVIFSLCEMESQSVKGLNVEKSSSLPAVHQQFHPDICLLSSPTYIIEHYYNDYNWSLRCIRKNTHNNPKQNCFILFSKVMTGKVIMFKTLKPTTNISKMFAMRNR